jgi:hypothetical protein
MSVQSQAEKMANDVLQGKMSIEADIFSFGATFWECLNVFELITRNKDFSNGSYEFYKKHFLSKDIYLKRDLSCTSIVYHRKLEKIIQKCTHRSHKHLIDDENEIDDKNQKYYHSYKTLKNDIKEARNSIPSIIREENIKARNAFKLSGYILSIAVIFLIIIGLYRASAFNISVERWEMLTVDYNITQFDRLQTIAIDMINSVPANRTVEIYDKIAEFLYEDNISSFEATLLVRLLNDMGMINILADRVDMIMQNANPQEFRGISIEIIKLESVKDSIGYELAAAIYNAEIGRTNITEAYEILINHQENIQFKNAVVKLKNILDNDEYIRIISEETNISRNIIKNNFQNIG